MIRAAVPALLACLVPLAPAQAEPCAPIASGVALCLEGAAFDPGPSADATAGRLTGFLGPFGLSVEVAPLSATAHADPWWIRRELDAYLAARRGFEDGALPELARDRLALPDRAAEQVVYRLAPPAETSGAESPDLVVADTVILGDGFAVYVETYDAAEGFTEGHRGFHDAVLAGLRLPAPLDPGGWAQPAGRPEPRPLAPALPETGSGS